MMKFGYKSKQFNNNIYLHNHSGSVYLCSTGSILPSSPFFLFRSSDSSSLSPSTFSALDEDSSAVICFSVRFWPILTIEETSLKVEVSVGCFPKPLSQLLPSLFLSKMMVASVCCFLISSQLHLLRSARSSLLKTISCSILLKFLISQVSRADGRKRAS